MKCLIFIVVGSNINCIEENLASFVICHKFAKFNSQLAHSIGD